MRGFAPRCYKPARSAGNTYLVKGRAQRRGTTDGRSSPSGTYFRPHPAETHHSMAVIDIDPILDLFGRHVFELGIIFQKIEIGCADDCLPKRHGRNHPCADAASFICDFTQLAFVDGPGYIRQDGQWFAVAFRARGVARPRSERVRQRESVIHVQSSPWRRIRLG